MAKVMTQGWRRAVLFNTIAVSILTTLGIAFLAWSVSKGSGLDASHIIFEGDCSSTKAVNMWLHLALNVCSTGVLASSSFFMQIMTSPTRRDVDTSHKYSIPLTIGVPSIPNLFHVSKLKATFWVLLFITSFPIHLLFNSAIFSTQYFGADWHMTIASEGFTNGAQYFGPGAVLWRAGAPNSITDDAQSEPYNPDREAIENTYEESHYRDLYGAIANITLYFDYSSNVSTSIKHAADNSRRWKRLEVPECLSQYLYCSPRTELRDIVLVVKSHNSSRGYMVPENNVAGWTWQTIMGHMSASEAAQWSLHVPANESNSLWFAADCKTTNAYNTISHLSDGCKQTCNGAVGINNTRSSPKSVGSIPSNFTFDFFPDLEGYSKTDLHDMNWNFFWPGLSDRNAAMLDLEYCLAEQRSVTCKVAILNASLMTVILCLFIKTIVCIGFMATSLKEEPLVVPGDAIASFICVPDQQTRGICTLDQDLLKEVVHKAEGQIQVARPMPWRLKRRRWVSSIRGAACIWSYILFVGCIILLAAIFAALQSSNPIHPSKVNLLESTSNAILDVEGGVFFDLFSSIIKVNMPQILLSISYLAYNTLCTRICVEKEWNSYSIDFKTLRVSQPQGQQRSTYRLQLPYRYSTLLICVSIALHWMVSNVLYVFVFEGGYYSGNYHHMTYSQLIDMTATTGLSIDAFVGVGYSIVMVLALLVAAVVLPAIPLILASRQAKGTMPCGGSDSLILSAACHIPVLDNKPQPQPPQRFSETETCQEQTPAAVITMTTLSNRSVPELQSVAFEMQQLLNPSEVRVGTNLPKKIDETLNSSAQNSAAYLQQVSQEPICWGAINASAIEGAQDHDTETTGHLSFGTKNHDIQAPVVGYMYA